MGDSMMAALALASLGRKQLAHHRPISMSAIREAARQLSPVYPLARARAALAQSEGLPLTPRLTERSQTTANVRMRA